MPLITPHADFSAAPTSGAAPLAVTFTDASNGTGYVPASWAWDFGDGNTSALQNPLHNYAAVGSYSVTLTVPTWSPAYASQTITYANLINATGPSSFWTGFVGSYEAP